MASATTISRNITENCVLLLWFGRYVASRLWYAGWLSVVFFFFISILLFSLVAIRLEHAHSLFFFIDAV